MALRPTRNRYNYNLILFWPLVGQAWSGSQNDAEHTRNQARWPVFVAIHWSMKNINKTRPGLPTTILESPDLELGLTIQILPASTSNLRPSRELLECSVCGGPSLAPPRAASVLNTRLCDLAVARGCRASFIWEPQLSGHGIAELPPPDKQISPTTLADKEAAMRGRRNHTHGT